VNPSNIYNKPIRNNKPTNSYNKPVRNNKPSDSYKKPVRNNKPTQSYSKPVRTPSFKSNSSPSRPSRSQGNNSRRPR